MSVKRTKDLIYSGVIVVVRCLLLLSLSSVVSDSQLAHSPWYGSGKYTVEFVGERAGGVKHVPLSQ